MDKLQITLDQLKNYLGNGLKVTFDAEDFEHDFVGLSENWEGVELISQFGDYGRCSIDKLRPICYRLSDLDKFIPELGFVPLVEFADRFKNPRKHELKWYTNSMGIKQDFKAVCTKTGNEVVFDHRTKMFKFYDGGCANWFTLIQQSQLFQWHFWPFGEEYFEQGLVIDKMNYERIL